MSTKKGEAMPLGTVGERSKDMLANKLPITNMDLNLGEIEYVLKIPRTMDPKMAEIMNERHKKFVEDEFRHFFLALRDAERLSSECIPSSRRPRAGAQGNNEQP